VLLDQPRDPQPAVALALAAADLQHAKMRGDPAKGDLSLHGRLDWLAVVNLTAGD
jgi:hypothetical protein